VILGAGGRQTGEDLARKALSQVLVYSGRSAGREQLAAG